MYSMVSSVTSDNCNTKALACKHYALLQQMQCKTGWLEETQEAKARCSTLDNADHCRH